jgi:D-3-phosphoglycerate dehydrogenase
MPKVLISDQMDPKAAEIFRANGVEVDERPGLTKEELKAIIGDYDGLAIRSATKVTADLLSAAPASRWWAAPASASTMSRSRPPRPAASSS